MSDTTPNQSERLDEILSWVEHTDANILDPNKYPKLKTAIQAMILEAQLNHLAYINQRMIGENTSGDRVFYDKEAVIAENKLKDWQRNILNHIETDLEAQLEQLKGVQG